MVPSEMYGSMVFNDSVMRQRLPHDTYRQLKRILESGGSLDRSIADIVANAMKDWALEKGATHFTHWFQPMTGITAEKHEAFINPAGDSVIMEFSGKELIKGENDASSFPSGGLRATFEARGYTAWDPTSYAFIKDKTLCIPTAFCSYTGEALDKKTPLLRSMELINRHALRVLELLGVKAQRVQAMVGAEQEYFLIDRAAYEKRPDLIYTGRTLIGHRPSKGQELDDHFLGTLKTRVSAFMRELDEELWMLGIPAKTCHNEAAPAQHELACVYESVNVAVDHNQLIMEIMKKIANRHGMVCLLHEKPFDGVNGSGKHNNWSLQTDTGRNLLDPGDNPAENLVFLLMLCAVIQAVDDYQDLLRVSVASAGNDHRLGGNEAPPAIISIFIGDELAEILQAIETGASYQEREHSEMTVGVHMLPKIPKDATDRNRTSPSACTGNKFEFRSVGASVSIADANIVLNTIVAESLRKFADRLERAEDFQSELHQLIVDTIRSHRRILFNGNNYAPEWAEEAARRGLANRQTTVDALPCMLTPENKAVFITHGVFSETELHSRYEIWLEKYVKVLNIEAETTLFMARRQILPAVIRYMGQLAGNLNSVQAALADAPLSSEKALLQKISEETERLTQRVEALQQVVDAARPGEPLESARYEATVVLPAMNAVREAADRLEPLVAEDCWPFPTYSDLLFSV